MSGNETKEVEVHDGPVTEASPNDEQPSSGRRRFFSRLVCGTKMLSRHS